MDRCSQMVFCTHLSYTAVRDERETETERCQETQREGARMMLRDAESKEREREKRCDTWQQKKKTKAK